MAKIIRSAKPGSKWTTNKLEAYNITIRPRSEVQFLEQHLGAINHLDPSLFAPFPLSTTALFLIQTCRLLGTLKLALDLDEESLINDFLKRCFK